MNIFGGDSSTSELYPRCFETYRAEASRRLHGLARISKGETS